MQTTMHGKEEKEKPSKSKKTKKEVDSDRRTRALRTARRYSRALLIQSRRPFARIKWIYYDGESASLEALPVVTQ